MKKLSSVLLLVFFANIAMADCDFKTGISPLDDGSFKYSRECHLKVGQMKQDLDVATKQVADLTQAITLKDLALTKSDQRVTLWQDTSFKLEDRINTIDSLQKFNGILYFGLGVVFTSLAVWGAGHLAAH